MPATLFLRPSPRAYFLLTETHALIFRQPDASETKASRSVVIAEFLPLEQVDTRGLVRASRGRVVEGVLGVTSVPSERSPIPEIFLLLVSSSSPLPPLIPGSSLRPSKIVSVEFHSLSSSFWDSPEILSAAQTGGDGPRRGGADSWQDDDPDDPYSGSGSWASSSGYHTPTQSQASTQGVEHPCAGMRKYLESGGFFFAEGAKWDISTRMGEENWIKAAKSKSGGEGDTSAPSALEGYDERFVWNASLLAPLLAFRSGLSVESRGELDEQALLIPVIQGFVGSSPISSGEWAEDGRPDVASLGIISRLSWKRAGARFRTRGIDDDGQVANFVETEVILALRGVVYTWAVVRGSVPLFWQQPSQGIQTLQQKVEITRPPQASQPAFDRHFLELLDHYHSVHAVNLLGQKDAESMLSAAYSEHLSNLKQALQEMPADGKGEFGRDAKVDLTPYDFHSVVRAQGHEAVRFDMGTRLREVVGSRRKFGWTAIDAASGGVIERQRGVFRVNCLDCLDRTNYVQDVLSSLSLTDFLQSIGSPLAGSQTFWSAHRILWADNGDRLSKTYAGTGALNTSATRSGKKTFAGLLSDATKSLGRAYINNFQDKGKQAAIDMLLGMMAGQRPVILFDPVSDSIHSALSARVEEYSRERDLKIWVGTWNLNGTPPGERLGDWLFPSGKADADVYMIAFQEIVQLTAQQILQTDPAKRRMWEKYLVDTFTAQTGNSNEYILYRSEQLVGTALIIIVKSTLTSAIRHVESATKKTGLQGLSGNKGGVGIRCSLFDSTVCFMTCHLAAGHSNVAERNADYKTVREGLKFLRGKTIEDHDLIFWAADFNYRVSMPNEDVRTFAEQGDIDSLLTADQLLQAVDEGEVFQGYTEGSIKFLPTYKYDNGTDVYDTSEKARIPAWTDRILFRGSAQLERYDRAELRTSDHRPVYAVLNVKVREVDEGRKADITREIGKSLGIDNGKAVAAAGTREMKKQPPPPPMHTKPVMPDLLGGLNVEDSAKPRSRSPIMPVPPPTRSIAKVDRTEVITSPTAANLPRRPPPPLASASKQTVSLLDEDDDDKQLGGRFSVMSKPLLPSRPSIGQSSDSAQKPTLPMRKPTGSNNEDMTKYPPRLPQRSNSSVISPDRTSLENGPAKAPPKLPNRKPTIDSIEPPSLPVKAPSNPQSVPSRPSVSNVLERQSGAAKNSVSPENEIVKPKSGSVLGAIAAFEAATKQPSSSASGIAPGAASGPPKIKRKPAPSSSLSNAKQVESRIDTGTAINGHSRGSTAEEMMPSVTGDFVLVPRTVGQGASSNATPKGGDGKLKVNDAGKEGDDVLAPPSVSPVKTGKAPPPVAKKPINLRSVSGGVGTGTG